MRRRAALLLAVALVSCHRQKAAPPAPAPPPPPRVVVTVNVTPSLVLEPLDRELREGSSVVLARAGERRVAFVADEDESAVHTVDLATRSEIARTDLEGRPTSLLITAEGTLAVALRDVATVALLGTDGATPAAIEKPLVTKTTLPTADEPIALANGADGALFVASGWGHALESFAGEKHEKVKTIALGREPRAFAVASDGGHAFVAYAAEGFVDEVDLRDGERRAIGLGTEGHFVPLSTKMPMPPRPCRHVSDDFDFGECPPFKFHPRTMKLPGRVGRQAFAMLRTSGSRERFIVPHVEVGPGEPMVISGGYGGGGGLGFATTAFDVAIIDGATSGTRLGDAPDAPFEDCLLPRGGALARGTGTFAVSCTGSDTVALFDDGSEAPRAKGRVKVAGGPWGIAWDPKEDGFWVAAPFTRTLQLVPRATMLKAQAVMPTTQLPQAVSLSHRDGRGLAADAAAGRKLFYAASDARISSDGRSCASCHPDGRDDGLVWPTPHGPRQTLLLAGRVRREAPFGWDGKHGSLAVHIKSTLENLHGNGLAKEDVDALAAYLIALPPPPRSTHPRTEDEQRGAELFASAQTTCFACHGEDSGFTDGAAHDVKSATSADTAKEFLAPSLRYIAGSAPYFHDGRYATLAELIRGCDGTMGTTKDLSDADVRALEAYLRTL